MPHDRDLRERFAKLRREDQAHAGEFKRFLHRSRPRANAVHLSIWVAVAGLAVMIAVVTMSPRRLLRRTFSTPEISVTEWKSSTDFLLRTPGLELLRTIPRVGERPAFMGNKGGRRNSPASRKTGLTKTAVEENLS